MYYNHRRSTSFTYRALSCRSERSSRLHNLLAPFGRNLNPTVVLLRKERCLVCSSLRRFNCTSQHSWGLAIQEVLLKFLSSSAFGVQLDSLNSIYVLPPLYLGVGDYDYDYVVFLFDRRFVDLEFVPNRPWTAHQGASEALLSGRSLSGESGGLDVQNQTPLIMRPCAILVAPFERKRRRRRLGI